VPVVEVEGREVELDRLDFRTFPRTGFTKADVVEHYVRAAPRLLPWLAGRPVTLRRFPQTVERWHDFETRCPPHPPWVATRHMDTFAKPDVHACVIDDLPALVWAVNLHTVELHPFLGTVEHLDRPTHVVFDLDPGAPAAMPEACEVALALHDLLDDLGLRAWAKTSGGKGLHVVVPLNADDAAYARTKAFARAVAGLLVKQRPDLVTDVMARSERSGRVLVDWSQNDHGKSTVAPWSLRADPHGPTVSLPVTWEEVAEGPPRSGPEEALARPDHIAGALDLRQRLPA
jgi:bifunctional non-homologous end joining protein LigD